MLAVSNLTCLRGGVPVLERVDLKVAAGQALILRGPNGSGKTTLLRTLAGLAPAAAGEISVDPDAIAYAGHADGLKASLSVSENLAFWAAIYGAQGIEGALDAFDLAGLGQRQAGHLSAGQKRRLGLARLVVTARPIWALDEPTVSLDSDAVGLFRAALTRHLAEGGLAVIATHIDLGIAAEELDLQPFRAAPSMPQAFAEAFE